MGSINKLHIAKTITWRITATLTTFIIAWSISGDLSTGIKIGAIEFVVKMFLYFFHEKIWHKTTFSKKANE